MSLRPLLKPVKYLDQQILREYTKLTKKWEDKGRSRYSLAHIFNFSGFASKCSVIFYGLQTGSEYDFVSILYGVDLARNIMEPKIKTHTSDTMAKNPSLSLIEKIGKLTRLPFFGVGVTYMGKGVVNIFSGISSGENTQINEGLSDMFFGYSFFGLSSSAYVKDSDPKLLDKQPFWKKAYNWAREKLSPSPQPVPVPITKYSTLDDYVGIK